MRKPFSAVPLQRFLVQIANRHRKRPDFLDTELTRHRERECLTHTVVIRKHFLNETRTGLSTGSCNGNVALTDTVAAPICIKPSAIAV